MEYDIEGARILLDSNTNEIIGLKVWLADLDDRTLNEIISRTPLADPASFASHYNPDYYDMFVTLREETGKDVVSLSVSYGTIGTDVHGVTLTEEEQAWIAESLRKQDAAILERKLGKANDFVKWIEQYNQDIKDGIRDDILPTKNGYVVNVTAWIDGELNVLPIEITPKGTEYKGNVVLSDSDSHIGFVNAITKRAIEIAEQSNISDVIAVVHKAQKAMDKTPKPKDEIQKER